MSIAARVQRHAILRPEAGAISCGAAGWTFDQLGDRAARLAGALRAEGLRPGDRVAIVQRNGLPFLDAMLAAFHGGFPVVPLNARSTPYEARTILEDADVAAIFYDADHAEHAASFESDRRVLRVDADGSGDGEGVALDAAIERSPGRAPVERVSLDDPAWLFYTSGTTGAPKGAILTHRNLTTMALAYQADLRRVTAGHAVLHVAPLSHGSGLYALPALLGGARQVISDSASFDPARVLSVIRSEGVSDVAFLAPTMVKWLCEALVEDGGGLPTLEHVVYGGAPMHEADLVAALDAFGPVLSQIYGQAEAPVTISCLPAGAHAGADSDVLTSAGWAYAGVDVAVAGPDGPVAAGEGEIVTRSDAVMAGYWRNDEATAAAVVDGWLRTGDLGEIDADGLIRLKDRDKDVIISGGANIYPREVEDVLLQHDAVHEAAVIGAPDDVWGERVVAILVADDPARAGDALEDELDGLCRERLSGYKRPRVYEWRDKLPTSSYGKVLKRELRASFWRKRERSI